MRCAAPREPGFPFSVGHGLGTPDNPIFPGHARERGADRRRLGGRGAGNRPWRGRSRGQLLRRAAPRDGRLASGFGVYNDAALAIAAMLQAGVRKVAYVDVDAHHADGVQAAFYADPRVLTVSIHQSPLLAVPRHRLPDRVRRRRGERYVRQHRGAGGHRGRGVVAGLPRGRPGRGARVPAGGTGHPARRGLAPGGSVGRPEPDRRRAPHVLRGAARLAETVTGGRWLALGGGGYSPVRVVPRSWTHLLAIVSGHDIDPATPLPAEWLSLAAAARPGIALPVDMSDGTPHPVTFRRWDGTVELAVDRAIRDTRCVDLSPARAGAYDPRD